MIEQTIKILLLEDQKIDQELTTRAVRKVAPNAVFILADSQREFMEKVKDNTPDLIISDYQLPDWNGLEAMLYSRQHFPGVPFIFLTGALNDEEKVAEMILKGASGYVLKDRFSELPAKLESVVRQAQQHIEKLTADREERTRLRILLQKANAILKNTQEFPEKKVLLETLQEIEAIRAK
jgi:CheY-like chemotaxis protein